MSSTVILCTPENIQSLGQLLARYAMQVELVDAGTPIPGSYWGDSEAGLIRASLFVRTDTPLHSALHEACHFICMDEARRELLHTDAGGEIPEENAVCYLQALLADEVPGYDRWQLFADMDAWGYTFRLGSAQAWFEQDAKDALTWLLQHQIIDNEQCPTGQLRR
ncbi:MAG: hypothetical protein KDI22_01090 [Gammaproteobacteria bacterium]|nr:hypothetical protein [Gammaproteobacteria bacterium]HPE80980.1 hypothetical protein [Gammaproteobacteria bacterium]